MLQAIRQVFLQLIADIDAGNSNIDEGEAEELIRVLQQYTRSDIPISKYQAYTFLNVSRATFDNMVREGKIPQGKKIEGFKELVWYKKDLKNLKT